SPVSRKMPPAELVVRFTTTPPADAVVAFAYWSRSWMVMVADVTPLVSVCALVEKLSAVATPATSVSVPKLVTLLVTPTIDDVPVLVILPPDSVPDEGRTRRFCQVNVFAAELVDVMVNVICVDVTELTASEVPLAVLLMFLPLLLSPLMRTVGAVPPVSKTKPVGTLRMIVPLPASPEAVSV